MIIFERKSTHEAMKGIQIEKPGLIKVVDLKKPDPEQGEVLLRINYVGFCGSDLNTYLGKNPMVQYPRIPGHEISAEIVDAGKLVPEGFDPGTAVTVVPYTNCGECPSCRKGRPYACRHNQTLGLQRDGAMKEYLAIPWQKILKAPKLNGLELAMVEPLTVGFHAIERGRVRKTDLVMVLGCGMIGAGAIIGAVIQGASVIAVDIDDQKLQLATQLGAKYTINSMKYDLHQMLSGLTGGEGVDVAVEAAGMPATYRAAIDEAAFTGRVVCIGYTAKEVSMTTKLIVQKELDVLGSRNASSDDFLAVISYLEHGTFPLDDMITRRVGIGEAGKALGEWADDPGKVMKILLDVSL